jgi:type II restriction enzyme
VAPLLRFSRPWPLPLRSRVSELEIRFLPDSQLEQNHASMNRFGSSIKPLLEISQRL